jgi:uncharacterized phage-associated protein
VLKYATWKGGFEMLSSIDIANSVVYLAHRDKVYDLTPMKLQKIMYFVYKEYLKRTEKPLFPEKFRKWEFGPVEPVVYHKFKYSRKRHIDFVPSKNGKEVKLLDFNLEDDLTVNIVETVWDVLKNKSAANLSYLTHLEGSAWNKTKDNYGVISDEDIKNEQIF